MSPGTGVGHALRDGSSGKQSAASADAVAIGVGAKWVGAAGTFVGVRQAIPVHVRRRDAESGRMSHPILDAVAVRVGVVRIGADLGLVVLPRGAR